MRIQRALVGFAGFRVHYRICSLMYVGAFQASALRSCSSRTVWMCQQLPGKQFVPRRCQRKGAPKAVEQLFLCAWIRKTALNWWLSCLIAAVLGLAMLYDRHKVAAIYSTTCLGKNLLEDTAVVFSAGFALSIPCTVKSHLVLLPLSFLFLKTIKKKKNSLTCWLMRAKVLQNIGLFQVWQCPFCHFQKFRNCSSLLTKYNSPSLGHGEGWSMVRI